MLQEASLNFQWTVSGAWDLAFRSTVSSLLDSSTPLDLVLTPEINPSLLHFPAWLKQHSEGLLLLHVLYKMDFSLYTSPVLLRCPESTRLTSCCGIYHNRSRWCSDTAVTQSLWIQTLLTAQIEWWAGSSSLSLKNTTWLFKDPGFIWHKAPPNMSSDLIFQETFGTFSLCTEIGHIRSDHCPEWNARSKEGI